VERSGHSTLGIISFAFSLLGAAFVLLWIILAGLDADDALVGLAVILQLFISVVSTGLGLPALFTTAKKRLFAILGVIFGVAEIAITLGLLVAGMIAMATGFAS